MAIGGLKDKQAANIKSVFAKFPHIDEVILYGSRAKGTYRNGSDIDLTIKGTLSLTELSRVEIELDDLLLPYKIDLSLHSKIDNLDLLEHIERVGKLFYGREHDGHS